MDLLYEEIVDYIKEYLNKTECAILQIAYKTGRPYTKLYYCHISSIDQLLWIQDLFKQNLSTRQIYSGVTINGDIKLLKWLGTQHSQNKWNSLIAEISIIHGKLEILNWLYLNNRFVENYNVYFCVIAAKYSQFEILKWLRQLDPPCNWSCDVYHHAIHNKQYEIIKWARYQDPPCPHNLSQCFLATEIGDLYCLKLLRENDHNNMPLFPWVEHEIYEKAINNNHFEIVKWLRTNRNSICYTNSNVCIYAARANNLEILQFLRSEYNEYPPCPWDNRICIRACINNNLELLQWARSCNPPCPWNKKKCMAATKNKAIKEWILSSEN